MSPIATKALSAGLCELSTHADLRSCHSVLGMSAHLFALEDFFGPKLVFKEKHANIIINICLKIQEQDQQVTATGSNQSSSIPIP